jgi:(R,R)-butanediol dehydrogenase/meso-butanediol dehydrogenase/diacetyl reductase
MKAAVIRGVRDVEVSEVPVPVPEAGEVLIKVRYCGICGSDVEAYLTGMYERELIIGHEFSGEVIEVGEGVYGWAEGDRVTVNGVIPCGRCWFCHRNMASLCEDLYMPGITHNGAMAEYVKVPAKGLHPLPNGVSFRQAAIVDPMACALHGVRLSRLMPGDRVLVLGAGPIGLLALQCAYLAGAREVYVSEISPKRAELARKLGALAVFDPRRDNLHVSLDELTEGMGVDIVFVCAGVPVVFQEAITLVRRGGKIVALGICGEPVEADFMTIVMNELSIKGGYCGYEEYPICLDYIAQGRIDVDSLVSDEIALKEIVEKGFEALIKPETDAVKILVKF